ncbi:uncharacterized protein B0I36DRAFT_309644 [Microdochium trichocladiopsis]|uniref:Secreted protein n=1 Tax=Microdochium trichocladiopsis TaxID=1682393 RepID=A0A9P9BV44_9PEZI|nr:uncharacterized protein B0I36DRAFT_309644 [Microdochium trichocladiopsis]KAH7039943.1 hypothetical protein B0I36DRAFT_309644 [Microdochium trichocladiopsis]
MSLLIGMLWSMLAALQRCFRLPWLRTSRPISLMFELGLDHLWPRLTPVCLVDEASAEEANYVSRVVSCIPPWRETVLGRQWHAAKVCFPNQGL